MSECIFCYAVRAKPGPPHWGLAAATRLRPQTPKATRL